MLTKLYLNNYILKNKYSKIGKGLLHFVKERAPVNGNYYLKMLKKHLYVTRTLSCGQKFTIQQYGARCHRENSVTNYLNENFPDYIRKENDLLILLISIYLIMQFGT